MDRERKYTSADVKVSKDGVRYIDINDVFGKALSLTEGNSKTGSHVWTYNTSIYYTCDHNCECYKGYTDENGVHHDAPCYAQTNLYLIPDNMAGYTNNFLYTHRHTVEEISASILAEMDKKNFSLFRYFTCGDFTEKVLKAAVIVAKARPGVKFWAYTKKYGIINRYCDENGGRRAIPDNLTIIFSHWMNHDGTYFPMNNPYNFPTSEFIPCGREDLAEHVTHICPCSNPAVLANCETCEHPCYDLKDGQSMALKEHSTSTSRTRDKELSAAHKTLKDAAKAIKEQEKAIRKALKEQHKKTA